MALSIILLLLGTTLYNVSATYTTKYDNIDIDEVIKNERLVKKYVDCLLEQGACTPEGLELKKNMPDAIQTNCEKCSEKQKQASDKFVAYLIDNKEELWIPLQEKYDPSGDYTRQYLESKGSKQSDESADGSEEVKTAQSGRT